MLELLDSGSQLYSSEWVLLLLDICELYALLRVVRSIDCVSNLLTLVKISYFFIRAFCATLVQASVLNPFFTPILILFAGVLVPPQAMPGFWRAWLYKIDPYHYFLEGVVTDVLQQVKVVCRPQELIPFRLNPTYLPTLVIL